MGPAQSPVNVAIGAFEDLVALGLRALVRGDASLQVVAGDVPTERLGSALDRYRPAVLLLDWDQVSGVGVVDDLRRDHPGTRLLVLTGRDLAASCAEALERGAAGCLGKDAQGRDIINAIHLASRGLRLLPDAAPSTAGASRPPPDGSTLTPREVEVLRALQEGCTNAEAARRLAISLETVRTHSRNIYRKLGVRSRRELQRAAVTGLPPREEEHAPATANGPS
jgi:DNA-binding NarL/FixJ family response regulator